MRKIFFIVTILLLCACKSVPIKKELGENLFDKFDYELWKSHYEGFEKGIGYETYIYKDIEFYRSGVAYIYISSKKTVLYNL